MKIFITALSLLLFASYALAQDPVYPPAPAAPGNIVSAEYFMDADPGFGNANAITIASPNVDLNNVLATLNTTGLSNGIHRFGLRTKNADGVWSHTDMEIFLVDFNPAYPASPSAPVNIISAEYFIDTDPGFGNANAITITSPNIDVSNVVAALNTTGLSNGIHRFGLRTKNADGKWSHTDIEMFLVDFDPAYAASPAAVTNMVTAEYYIDTDPGFGNANAITIPTTGTDVSDFLSYLNTASLSNGVHHFGIRSKNADGRWSLTNVQDFLVDGDPVYPVAPATPGNITYAEYFFDNDPGFGNGTLIPITAGPDLNNVAFVANTSALADGAHTLFIRSFDDWSITNFTNFNKGTVLPLDFLSFTAVGSGNDIVLNWQTENEINTDHFDVEFSIDGIRFQKIGKKPAANAAGKNNYRFIHLSPGEGKYFYRIRQVDKDGKFKFSNIIAIALNQQDKLKLVLYPNPATNMVWLKNINASDVVYIQLIDMNGRILKSITPGSSLQIQTNHLSSGTYSIKIKKKDGTMEVRPFIKQ